MRSIPLKNRKADFNKLIEYGFSKSNDEYIYKAKICGNQFEVVVCFSEGSATARIFDLSASEEYVLADIEGSTGKFVGAVKEEYEGILNDIISRCTCSDVFKSAQTKEVINYVVNNYGDELEFLWEKFPTNAIFRNKQSNKWYGVLGVISKEKLNLKSKDAAEVLIIRCEKEKIEQTVNGKTIFPGYHMNKKSWITVVLDGRLDTADIKALIDKSYCLSGGNKKDNELFNKVFDYLLTIPKGKVVTYKQVAEHLGNKGLARAVGNILHKNPDEKKYPCYKVLNSKGELAESFVFGGADVQKKRLENEGIAVVNNKVDLAKFQWKE